MCLPAELQKGEVGEMMRSPIPELTTVLNGVNMGEVLYFGAVRCGPAALWQGLQRVRGLSAAHS